MTLNEAIQSLNWSIDLIPEGESNRPRTPLSPTRVTIHNTANAAAGADALAHAKYVKGPDARARKVSWHYTADDERVVQHLPDDEVGWQAGSGNSKSIAVEICEHEGIDQSAANARAALLVAVLLRRHKIELNSVVPHQFWTGKHCPARLLEASGGFQAFVELVSERANGIQDTEPSGSLTMNALPVGDLFMWPERDLGSRVRILEQLLGRAIADAEICRREIEALRNDHHEAP